jgi:hypothetical protein
MTQDRENEIVSDLQSILDEYIPTDNSPILDMFYLISTYNRTGKNIELIGGQWAQDHGFNIPS